MEVEVEREVGVVDAGVRLVDEVPEVHRDLTGLREEGGVPGDVAGHGPEDAVGPRLGGAAAEQLGAGEPDAEDAVELAAAAVGAPLGHGERERRAAGPRGGEAGRRRVGGGGGGPAVGGAEGAGEEQRGAGPRAAARRADRAVHLEERGRRLRRVGRGGAQGRAEAVPVPRGAGGRRGGVEESEEEEDARGGGGGGRWRHCWSGEHEGRREEKRTGKLAGG